MNKIAGQRLMKFRKQMNWTRGDLAYESGVSVRTIYNYERLGIPDDPRKLWPICRAMQLHISDVLGVSIFDIEDLLEDLLQDSSKQPINKILKMLETF